MIFTPMTNLSEICIEPRAGEMLIEAPAALAAALTAGTRGTPQVGLP